MHICLKEAEANAAEVDDRLWVSEEEEEEEQEEEGEDKAEGCDHKKLE